MVADNRRRIYGKPLILKGAYFAVQKLILTVLRRFPDLRTSSAILPVRFPRLRGAERPQCPSASKPLVRQSTVP